MRPSRRAMRASTPICSIAPLHNRFTLFGNVTNRDVWQARSCYDASYNSYNCRRGYRGERRGFEYQGDLTLGALRPSDLRRAQRDGDGPHVAGPGPPTDIHADRRGADDAFGLRAAQAHFVRAPRSLLWRPHRRRRSESHLRDMARDRRLSSRGDRNEIARQRRHGRARRLALSALQPIWRSAPRAGDEPRL